MFQNIYRGPSPISAYEVQWGKFPLPSVSDVIFCDVKGGQCFKFDKYRFARLVEEVGPDAIKQRFDLVKTRFNPVLWLKLEGLDIELRPMSLSRASLERHLDSALKASCQNYLYQEPNKMNTAITQVTNQDEEAVNTFAASAQVSQPSPKRKKLISARHFLRHTRLQSVTKEPIENLYWEFKGRYYRFTVESFGRLLWVTAPSYVRAYFGFASSVNLWDYGNAIKAPIPDRNYWFVNRSRVKPLKYQELTEYLERFRCDIYGNPLGVPNVTEDKGLAVTEALVIPEATKEEIKVPTVNVAKALTTEVAENDDTTEETTVQQWQPFSVEPATTGVKLVVFFGRDKDIYFGETAAYSKETGWRLRPDADIKYVCWRDFPPVADDYLKLESTITTTVGLKDAEALYKLLSSNQLLPDLQKQLSVSFPILENLGVPVNVG